MDMKLKQSQQQQRQFGQEIEHNFNQRQIRNAREIIKKNFKTYEEVIFNMVLAMENVYSINTVLRPTVQESLIKPLMDSSPAELAQLLLKYEARCKTVIYKYSQDSYLCSTQESNKVVPTESANMNQTANLEGKSEVVVPTAASPPTVAMDCNGKKRERTYSGVCSTQMQNLQQQSTQQLQQQYQSYEQIHPPQQQYQPQQLEQLHQQQEYHPQPQRHQPHQQIQQQSKQPQQIYQQQQQTQEQQIQDVLYKLQEYEHRLKSKQPQCHQSKDTPNNKKIQEVQQKQWICQMALKMFQQNHLKQEQQNIYKQQNIYEEQKQHPRQCHQEQYQHQYLYEHEQQYQQDQEKKQCRPFKQHQQQQQQTQIPIQSWTSSCAVENDSKKKKYANSRDMQTVANVKQHWQRKFKSTESPSLLPETYSQGNVTDAKYYWQRKSLGSGLPLLSGNCSQSDKESPLIAVPSPHSAMNVERTNNSELNNAAVSPTLRNEDSIKDAPEVFKNFSKHTTKLDLSPDDSQFNKFYPYCILNSLPSKPRDMPERDNYPHLYTLLLQRKSQASKENIVDISSTSTTDLSGKKRKREN